MSFLLLLRPEAPTSGVLRFNNSYMKWGTLAAPLANVSDGAWTGAFLFRRATVSTGPEFDALGYLLSGTGDGTTEAGLSITTGNNLNLDIGGIGSTTNLPSADETYIAWVVKPAGTSAPRFSKYEKSTNTWSTVEVAGSTLADQIPATMLELGAWQGQFDRLDAWVGLIAFWEGAMSDANRLLLSTNWRSSDWWQNPHGAPKVFPQLNVPPDSVVDLASNASGLTHFNMVLDPNQTLDGWTFDGVGTPTVALAGAIGSASSATGVLSVQAGLAGAITSASTATGSLAVTAGLAGTVASTSSVIGVVVIARSLAGAIASSSTLTGVLTARAALAGAATSVSTVAGSAGVIASLAGTIASSSTGAGTLDLASPLAGTVASAAALTGTLTNTAPGANALDGAIASTSSAAGVLSVRADLAGAVASTSSLTGVVTARVALVSTIASTSTLSGALLVRTPLAGQISSTSVLTGTLSNIAAGQNPLAGTIASTSTLTATMSLTKALSGAVASTSRTTGLLTAYAGLQGACSSTSVLSGSVTVGHPLAGQIAATSTLAGTVLVAKLLAGQIVAQGTVTATLTNRGPTTSFVVSLIEGGSTAFASEMPSLSSFSEGGSSSDLSESSPGILVLTE